MTFNCFQSSRSFASLPGLKKRLEGVNEDSNYKMKKHDGMAGVVVCSFLGYWRGIRTLELSSLAIVRMIAKFTPRCFWYWNGNSQMLGRWQLLFGSVAQSPTLGRDYVENVRRM